MIVVQVRTDFSFEIVDREKEMVRLGAGGLDGRRLTDTAMDAALQALSKFHRLAKSHQVDEILAAATSATREAENGPAFLAAITRETGIRPRVISGTEEARLIHLAAVYGVDVNRGRAVVIDIGGGSVEITVGGERPQLARSFKTGVIRMTERFVKSDPLAERDERKLTRHLQGEVQSFIKQVVATGFDRVIGTSGTILSIGSMAAHEMDGAAPDELRNRRIPSKQVRRLREKVTTLPLAQRLRMPGMEPRRADLIVAGAIGTRHDPARSWCRRHHALRSCAARGPDSRLHPSAPHRHRPRRPLSRRSPAQRRRAGGTLQLLGRSRRPGAACRTLAVRSDARRARPDRSRARVAGIRGAAARRRRAHQL